MAATPENPRNESTDVKTLISFYSNNVWRKLFSFFPSRDLNLFDKISNLHLLRTARVRSRTRKPGLPLPIPLNSLEFSGVIPEASRVLDVLNTILAHNLASLHDIQKSLRFWQSRAEGSGAQKVYFMVFERGPWAFIDGAVQLVHGCVSGGSPMQHLCHSAAAQISERILVLTRLQHFLAKFLAQVYMEVDKFGENLTRDPEKSLPSLLISINSLFLKLEASMTHSHEMFQGFSSSVDWNSSFPLLFDKLSEANLGGSQWTDCQIIDAVNLIHENLHRLDSFLSLIHFYIQSWTCPADAEGECGGDLVRPGITRFATNYIALKSFEAKKPGLRAMFASTEWFAWRGSDTPAGRAARETINSEGFWHDVKKVVTLLEPLVKVLRMVDSEKKPTLPHLYAAIDMMKRHVHAAIPRGGKRYLEIIQTRWEKMLMHPMHKAAYYLNPKYQYKCKLGLVQELVDAVQVVVEKLEPNSRMQSKCNLEVPRHRKPRRMTLYWFRYTCGAVGLTICGVWLLRHSSLMGSSDIDNWIREARDSTVSFWNDHVEQPLLSIRDELFETFRRRHRGVMELEEVQLTANSLHRMLLTFSEQTKGQKFPENVSDQEMMEIVMARYEKELMHPIQSLVGGELARALLIQIQKLKLDIETAMLELNQILKANEINFAILAALPAFFLSLILLMLLRAWFTKETGAEGRGRIARLQRRLLIVEVERRIMQFQNYVDQGLEDDAHCMFGLVLYSLDYLCKAVEKHAKATGEWLSLRQDISDLAKPGLQLAYKLAVTSRMERVYDCLLPSSKYR